MAKATSGRTHPPLVVRYYKRMKKQKVYTAQVSWRSAPTKGKGGEPYTVRLIMPGAQVVPVERVMDPGKPKDRAVFYVTPIAAKGQLRGERLEVLQQGQKVQEIAVPAKISSLRWFWIFLVLAFFLPWYLINYVQDPTGKEVGLNTQRWEQVEISIDEKVNKHLPGDIEKATATTGKKIDELVMVDDGTDVLRNSIIVLYDFFNQDNVMIGGSYYRANFPFWLGVFFFVLALLAWFLGREKVRKAVGKPVPIAD
jgi:hypothetical protein